MSKGTIITIIILGILVLFSIIRIIYKRTKGKNVCSCNCSTCTFNCEKRENK